MSRLTTLTAVAEALTGCAPSGLTRSLHTARVALFPKTAIGHGGRPGDEDPVQDLKEGAAKVRHAVSGDQGTTNGLLQGIKDVAGWAKDAASDTLHYTKANVENIANNTKEDLKKSVGGDRVDIPEATGPGTRTDHILERDFTSHQHPTAGPQSYESRMGGQPAGNKDTQPSQAGEARSKPGESSA